MNPSPPAPLPVGVALHLAGAVDALKLADDALGIALDALRPIDVEDQRGLDGFAIIGMQAAVRMFLGMFAGVADAYRLPAVASASRRYVEECREDARTVPGFGRAALALAFAAANLDEALDACDAFGGEDVEDDWHGKMTAASYSLGLLSRTIEEANITHRDGPPTFGLN